MKKSDLKKHLKELIELVTKDKNNINTVIEEIINIIDEELMEIKDLVQRKRDDLTK